MALFFYQFTPLYGHNLLITEKSAKKGTLSVKFELNLGVPPRTRKNPRHDGTDFHQYSVERSASHLS